MSGDGFIEPQFESVAIVGVGLIGGSLGRALKARSLAREVVGVGRSPERLQRAVDVEAIDRYTTELSDGIRHADLVVLCTTVQNILDILPDVLSRRAPGAIVTDVGSTKTAIVTRSEFDPLFVGGHPMAGSEKAGVESSNPQLFEKATWAITPSAATSSEAASRLTYLAERLGARVLLLSPEDHDAIVAVTSHLPHLMASALSRQAGALQSEFESAPAMSAGSFADSTRVAASLPEIWRDICLTNRDAILEALKSYREELDLAQQAIEKGDAAAIEAFFALGAEAKKTWKKP